MKKIKKNDKLEIIGGRRDRRGKTRERMVVEERDRWCGRDR